MSPTAFRAKGYRFFFFSRKDERIHVYVVSGDSEAIWGSSRQLRWRVLIDIQAINSKRLISGVEAHLEELLNARQQHFGG